MQIHELKPQTAWRRKRRIGRGGKRGTTAGRGTKGQKARAGAKIRPAIRDILKKLPKRRGYRFRPFRSRPVPLNLSRLAARFPDGASVDPAALMTAGLVRRMKGRVPAVKVLGGSPIAKRLHMRGVALSASARRHVLEAGGTVS